jgi:pimeloyl-ACP methyl ester carboxylesterase
MEAMIAGRGVPLVLIPGIQGRWEYMRPAVEALSETFRVITFPLCGERASRRRFDAARGLDNYVDQIDDVLNGCNVESAIVCGVSFGGLIALRYAAERPSRTSALVLASAPGPGFHLRRRHEIYAKAPLIFGPVLLAEMPRRVGRELSSAFSTRRDRARFAWRQVRTFFQAPVSVTRMAERSRFLGGSQLVDDCSRVTSRTLVVTGEPSLDYIVPVAGTSEYVGLIPGAQSIQIPGTGHLGYITRPDVFAGIVGDFVGTSRRMRNPHAAA